MWNVLSTETEHHNQRREAVLLSLAFVFLCFMSAGLTLAAAARIQDWTAFPGRLNHLLSLPVWAAGAWLLHREANRSIPDRDPFLLPIALLLSGWGMLMIWRLNPTFGLRQTLWFSLACLLVMGFLRLDPRLSWLRDYRYLWMTVALTLLSLTLIFGTNPLGGEPRLWLGCCGVYFQPSEPLRFFLVAFLAAYLGDRLRLDGAVTSRLPWRTFLPLMLVWGVSVLLLIVQRDLGTGMIFLALLASLLYLATGAWQVILASLVVAISGGALSYFLFGVVQVRVQAWLNPWLDPSGASYQIVQSLISIASGGLVGRGPGLGSPSYVPASHTDFIFTAIVEEFGLFGAVAVLALFAILVSRGLKIGLNHSDMFARFLSAGLTLAIGLQAIFIIGGVMRALPLVGITLPFVSYGGSSLLTSFASLAILLLISQSGGKETVRYRAFEAIQVGFSFAWLTLAFIAGWWTIYRSAGIVVRTDNPRRALDSRFVERGQIKDRNGVVLAESIGSPGEYERSYAFPSAAPLIGFDSALYGQAGIESSMDSVLRGLERGTYIENTWQRLITGHPPAGQDIALTLDIDLQSLSMDLLQNMNGAAVLLEAGSGELYVVASQPTYNPNNIDEAWGELIQDDRAPLINRATQGLYQPGLAIAPFLFSETLAQGSVAPDDPVDGLTSVVRINGFKVNCSLAPPQEVENKVEAALRYVCPYPLQRVFVDAGWETTRTAIDSFGLTEVTDVRLQTARAVELEGNPSEQELAQLVLGQGELQVSPLQMVRALAGLFSIQEADPLMLVQAIEDHEGAWVMQEAEGYRVPPSSKAVVSDLREIYAAGTNELFDFRAEALIGAEGQRLGWYLGLLQHDGQVWTVVVALEGEPAYVAEGIGRQILTAAEQLNP